MALAAPALGGRLFTPRAPSDAGTDKGWDLPGVPVALWLQLSISASLALLNSPCLKHTDGDSLSLLFSTGCKFKKRDCL